MIKNNLLLLLSLFICLIFLQCNPTETQIDNQNISLSIEDVSCTEVWLKFSSKISGSDIIITNNDTPVIQLDSFFSQDTLIYIDSLLPNRNYTFQAVQYKNGNILNKSEKITACHN